VSGGIVVVTCPGAHSEGWTRSPSAHAIHRNDDISRDRRLRGGPARASLSAPFVWACSSGIGSGATRPNYLSPRTGRCGKI